MNSLILDISVILIFLMFLAMGFRAGIMKSFLSLAGAVFSVLFAVYFANMLSHYIYVSFIEPSLIKEIGKVLAENSYSTEQIFNKLPKLILNSLPSYGITPASVNHIINSNSTVSAIPAKISALFSPVIINVLKSVLTALLFIVFLFIVRILSGLISNVLKVSVLKKSNTLLGGLFGLFKGYIAVTVCMCCLKVLLPVVRDVPDVFSSKSISSTFVFKELYNNNPVYEFFKNI